MAIREALLPEFDQEMANTRKVLERCPEEKYGWKPHQKSWDMATLATHLANIPFWGTTTIAQDSFDFAPKGAPPYEEKPVKSRKELLEKFDNSVKAMRGALAGASDEALMKPWSLLKTGETLFTMPRIAILRSFVMNHAIHHRAQLGVYLRLVDAPVPAIYGPSADETGM